MLILVVLNFWQMGHRLMNRFTCSRMCGQGSARGAPVLGSGSVIFESVFSTPKWPTVLLCDWPMILYLSLGMSNSSSRCSSSFPPKKGTRREKASATKLSGPGMYCMSKS